MQNDANQANVQFSTGPRTEPGKARASMNAQKHGLSDSSAYPSEAKGTANASGQHGLTGQFFVINEVDRLAYIDFECGILESLQPTGPYEHQLAVSIAQDRGHFFGGGETNPAQVSLNQRAEGRCKPPTRERNYTIWQLQVNGLRP